MDMMDVPYSESPMAANDEESDTSMLDLGTQTEKWCEYERVKQEPKKLLAEMNKRQTVHTKAIRQYMKDNSVDSFDCGDGLVITLVSAERTSFNEDVCKQYMTTETLQRLKCENTLQKDVFKVIRSSEDSKKRRRCA